MYMCAMRMNNMDRMDMMNRKNRMNRDNMSAMSGRIRGDTRGELSSDGCIILAALLVFGFAFLPLLLRQMA